MKYLKYILLLLWIPLFSGCEKEPDLIGLISHPLENGAQIKLFHALPGGPAFEALWQDKRLNAGLVTATTNPVFVGLTYGNTFPTTNNESLWVPAGSGKIALQTIANPNSTPAVTATPITTLDASMEAGKTYSLIAYGTTTAPLTYFGADNFPTDRNNVYIRLFNAIAGTTADLELTGTTLGVKDLEYGKMFNFVAVQVPTSSTNERIASLPFKVTLKGLGITTPISISNTFTDLGKGRVYTLILRGVVGSTTTAPTASLSVTRY